MVWKFNSKIYSNEILNSSLWPFAGVNSTLPEVTSARNKLAFGDVVATHDQA